MEQNNSAPPIRHAERDFKEFMQRGDDFFNIQLLRQAKAWYNKALSLNIGNEKAKFHISECERLLSFESKVVYILISVASILLLLYFLLF